MASLIVATGNILSSSASILTGIQLITKHLHVLLSPNMGFELVDLDRRRLMSVHRRIECISAPLNMCILLSTKHDSCVSETISYSRDVINAVSAWVESVRFVPSKSKPNTRTLDDETINQLEFYLDELNFVCNAVQMAVTCLNAMRASQASNEAQSLLPSLAAPLSLSALTRSIALLTNMRSKTGDLLSVQGTFFVNKDSKWETYSAKLRIGICQSCFSISLSYWTDSDGTATQIPVALDCEFQRYTLNGLIGENNTLDYEILMWRLGGPFSQPLDDQSDPEIVLVQPDEPQKKPKVKRLAETMKFLHAFKPVEYSCTDIFYLCKICGLEDFGRSVMDASDEELLALLT